MKTALLTQLYAGIQEDRQVLRTKRTILRELKKLPDDASRERVLRATLAFYGYPVPQPTPEEKG